MLVGNFIENGDVFQLSVWSMVSRKKGLFSGDNPHGFLKRGMLERVEIPLTS